METPTAFDKAFSISFLAFRAIIRYFSCLSPFASPHLIFPAKAQSKTKEAMDFRMLNAGQRKAI